MVNENDIEHIRKKYPSRIPRGRAIKLYCKEVCCCGDILSWKNCKFKACFLWNFRLGKELVGENKTAQKNNTMLSKNQGKQQGKSLSEQRQEVENEEN